MSLALLLDFGSTFTKLTVVDTGAATLVARAMAPTTTDDISRGLRAGLAQLAASGINERDLQLRLACSSAAGGLRLVAIGLVPELTAEAARRAALGAGARVIETFAYKLTDEHIRQIERLAPDILLLAGGTDGGNAEVLPGNARKLADAHRSGFAGGVPPIVVAGNKDVSAEAAEILSHVGVDVRVADNVMPELGVINVEPARSAIRDVFFEKIVEAKGLHVAEAYVEGVLMPTPAAVLSAAWLLADGTASTAGFGEVAVVDVGGATTDVHSIASGAPTERSVTVKGLPEPVAKRTVEGDLGVRVSAAALVDVLGEDSIAAASGLAPDEVRDMVGRLGSNPARLPGDARERALDVALARAAARVAMTRHAGTLETRATPVGLRRFQVGKDLTALPYLIGTGGVIVHGDAAGTVLRACVAEQAHDETAAAADKLLPLLPTEPRLLVDAEYLLAAAGLLAQRTPDAALALMKAHLRPV